MNAIPLPGCAPTPLAHYLKALGVLRLLSEQLPADAPRPRGAWCGEAFVLHTHLERAALERFFLHDYSPTPILAPWNGGSGFYFREEKLDDLDPETGKKLKTGVRNEETTATRILTTLLASKAPRLAPLRRAAIFARQFVDARGLEARPNDDEKLKFLRSFRSEAPEALLPWIDAAFVITDDSVFPPPILGSGGGDGNLDFSCHYVDHVFRLFDPNTGNSRADTAGLFRTSLYGETNSALVTAKIGQFFPDAAGVNNGGTGFTADGLVNPWDFVLMLEGALVFAAAAVRRMGGASNSYAAIPFTVAPTSVGYGIASPADTVKPKKVKRGIFEVWLPLWSRLLSAAEVSAVFSEGRATVRGQQARDGFDFARAVTSLGVDRGLSAFQRVSFQPRNGDAFFATPLDRVPVQRRQRVTDLLDDLDKNDWLDRVRGKARGDRVPNRVASAVRQLEQAALGLCRSSQHDAEECAAVEALLLAVADAEDALAHSLRWTQEKGLRPIRSLSSHWWTSLRTRDDAEFDLAAGLAGISGPCLRIHWEPVDGHPASLNWDKESREVFWADSRLEDSLLTIHQRRILLAKDKAVERVRYAVRPSSVAKFLERATDDLYLARLARALSLIDLPFDADRRDCTSEEDSFEKACGKLPALFSLPRLALAGTAPGCAEPMPRLAAILRRGASGDGTAATALAAQRLRGSGFAPALRVVPTDGPAVRRALAATIFPLSPGALTALAENLRPLQMHD